MSFDQETKQEQTTDQLTFKVGERSFDAQSAATKIEAGDQHIKKIESENQGYKDQIAALQAQVEQGTKIDDALAKLQQPSQESQPTEPTSSVSEEQIGAIATKSMEEYLAVQRVKDATNAAQALAEDTFKETGSKLQALYGDNTDQAMAAKAKQLGISTAAIFDMARNPTTASMLLESMKIAPSTNQVAPSGSLNTAYLNHAPEDSYMDYSKPITSSSVTEALRKGREAQQN